MVNENQGKEYNPTPVYDRKILRNMIRSQVKEKYGNHDVNNHMSKMFKALRYE